jgi:3-phosphoshikimate 1-carboxyvinyltransferase
MPPARFETSEKAGSFHSVLAVEPLGRPVAARVAVPGSKSLTNRALVAAALARTGVSRLYRPLEADDTEAMREALRALGVLIDDNDDPWLVLGTGGELEANDVRIDVRASGTTARFITAVAALAKGRVVVDGVPRMRERPIGPLVEAIRSLGGEASDSGGFPPVEVNGSGVLRGGEIFVDSSQSSQFASALLLVAPLAESQTTIDIGENPVSRPYLDGTVEIMRRFGAEVEVDGNRFVVQPTGYEKAHVDIEPDASAAVYPAVAAAITGGVVEIPGIPASSTQPDLAVLDVLGVMGAKVIRRDDMVRIEGPNGALAAVDIDMSTAPDGAMAVAVAALFADGPSRIHGLSTLRLKETDRLAALETELRRLGARAEVQGDTLVVTPGDLHGAEIATYGDHRMAMAFALVGLVVDGVSISDPGVVQKTWPEYFQMLEGL